MCWSPLQQAPIVWQPSYCTLFGSSIRAASRVASILSSYLMSLLKVLSSITGDYEATSGMVLCIAWSG